MEYQWKETMPLPATDIPSGNHIMQLQQKGKMVFPGKIYECITVSVQMDDRTQRKLLPDKKQFE